MPARRRWSRRAPLERWRRSWAWVCAGALLLADPLAAAAQGDRKAPVRIGVMTESWGPTPGVVGLREGLGELG